MIVINQLHAHYTCTDSKASIHDTPAPPLNGLPVKDMALNFAPLEGLRATLAELCRERKAVSWGLYWVVVVVGGGGGGGGGVLFFSLIAENQ